LTLLDLVRDRTTREVEVRLGGRPGRDVIRQLAGVFDRYAGDRRVSMVLDVNGGAQKLRVRTAIARRIRPTEMFIRDVEAICGAGSVTLK
jgi:hypothetical protein